MATPGTRRLAAILAADVAGYSRLMGVDEPATVAGLRAHRGEVTDPAIAQHGGRIVNTAGDSILAEFPSAVDAVRCADAIQRGMAARNEAAPPERRIVFRIGINVGDVISEGTEIYGDGVNIAARLEGICEPGGIAIGRNVYEQVQHKLPFAWQDAGPQRLKNIAEPVRVYRWRPGAVARRWMRLRKSRRWAAAAAILAALTGAAWLGFRAVTSFAPARTPSMSIVVLPFDNLSRDPAQDYFVDGLTEDLIADLSRVKGATVIARNTSFTYRGRAVDVKQVAAELNVRYALEGSVQRQGREVRVTVQLIDGQTGTHVWAERFDRTLENVFALQNEITGRLANSLHMELLRAESRKVHLGSRDDVSARDYAFRGIAELRKLPTLETYREALNWLQKAVELDPNLADAWAGIAEAHVRGNRRGWGAPGGESLRLAREAAERAVRVDPQDANGYSALAMVLRASGELDKATAALEKCLALDRNAAQCHAQLGIVVTFAGHAAESFGWNEKALALNPYDPNVATVHYNSALAHLLLGDDPGAIAAARRGISRADDWPYLYQILAAAYANSGDLDRARAALAEYVKFAGYRVSVTTVRSVYFGVSTDPTYRSQVARLFEGLRKAGLPED